MSGPCAKLVVRCTIVTPDGFNFTGENICASPQPACPRLPGEDYRKCITICRQDGHAEEVALRAAGGHAAGGHAYIEGHTHICRNCQEVLTAGGVNSFTIGPPPPPRDCEMKTHAHPASSPIMNTLAWEDCQRISDLPTIDDALRGFAEDPTGDNAVCAVRAILSVPVDMVLHCPACGVQHVDAPEYETDPSMLAAGITHKAFDGWTNPPHRSHLCHACNHIWRPADVPTNGVAAVKTRGSADNQIIGNTLSDHAPGPNVGPDTGLLRKARSTERQEPRSL